jgi:hypothetical protein
VNKLKCWKLYKKFRTSELLAKYRRLSKACSCSVRHFQNHVENNLVESGNLGTFYKYVNSKLNGSNGIPPLRDKLGNLTTSNTAKAALINDYFCSVFTIDDGVINPANLPESLPSAMAPPFFTPTLVEKYIKLLKTKSGSGPDGLPAIFYKNTASCISYPLSILFNLSLQTADIPFDWKLASVTPVFKKGSPSDPANYRPISLTCIASKLMETGIKDALLDHLNKYEVLSDVQHGFLKNKSTTTHLLECCLDWNIALRSKQAVDVIYLDFAKAFDSVVHSKLIAKLSRYCSNTMLVKWVASFLDDRFQYVRIGSSKSKCCPVLSGVPQGSILGPILFVIFINDVSKLCSSSEVSIKLFADDTKLYTVLQDDSAFSVDLQSSLDAILEWANIWQLKLAPAKCSVMRIKLGHSFSCLPSYHLADVSLPVVKNCTDLGVSFDERLSFSPHVSKIVAKASGRAKLILKCFRSRDSQLLVRAFCTFVRPLLEFSSIIWSPYTATDIKRIESVQRSFTKSITDLRSCTYNERLLNLGLDSLQCRRLKTDLIFCYKLIHGHVNMHSDNFFTRSVNTHLRGNSFKLVKPRSASVREANFFSHRVVDIWNSLPDSILTAESVSCFKRRLNGFDLSSFTFF